ncbi:MAG: NACHT domain-containing protein, partial [Planctomycetota bacterium]
MDNVIKFRVFASSPGDVDDEKNALQEAVKNINLIDGEQLGYVMKVVDWRDDIVPKIGEAPQDVVDAQLPDDDIYLGIMASRFGGGGTGKEFQDAWKRYQKNKPQQPWPHIMFYFRNDVPVPIETKPLKAYAKVVRFREQLQKLGITGTYTGVRGTDQSFYDQVHGALRKIVNQWLALQRGSTNGVADPRSYLDSLSKASKFIDIRGIGTDVIKHETELEIDKVYMTLTATGAAQLDHAIEADAQSDKSDEPMMRVRRSLSLDEVIKGQRLVVLTGDPGSGKTTFLRRLAFFLCELNLGRSTATPELEAELRSHPFPILVRISSFSSYLSRPQAVAERPLAESTPQRPLTESTPQDPDTFLWLPHYLGRISQDNLTGLSVEYFHQQLEAGRCTVLMDGLDETGNDELRERVVRILEQATKRYEQCRFIVTSRPGAYRDRAVLSGYQRFQIDALSNDSINDYLAKWCRSIKQIAQGNDSKKYLEELKKAVQVTDIRRMARNPVMLQALAVVHYNIGTMPEKRAHLYKAIIDWLVRSRRQRRPADGSELDPIKDEDLIERFRKLALAMQLHPQGRQIEVSRRWAASVLLLPIVATDQWKDDLPMVNSPATPPELSGANVLR